METLPRDDAGKLRARTAMTPRTALRSLETAFDTYGGEAAKRKLELLATLERASLGTAKEVLRLHELLCFLRAYPDDTELLAAVERTLARFEKRADLRRHRRALEDSGIAGTTTRFPFFSPSARRLVERWGSRVTIDWSRFENAERYGRILPHLTLWSERAAFDEPDVSARAWVRDNKGAGDTDAAFLVRRWHALAADEPVRSAFYDDLDPWLRLEPGPDTPARTREKHPGMRVVFQTGPLDRSRPDLAAEIRRAPRAVARVVGAEAEALIELARSAMVPRQRDLEVFAYANPEDVRLVDAGEGLSFACIGVLPERRSLLEAVYAFLMLKNGVAVGYSLCTVLFGSSEIAYNVFESFRGGETAKIFGRVLATVRHLFGSRSFAIDPYQLGHGNHEGIASGAFWFYAKQGFRPVDPGVAGLLDAELRQIAKKKGYRSSPATLEKLARAYVLWPAGGKYVLGVLSVSRVSRRVSAMLAERFGADRERAERTCLVEARARLGALPAEIRRWPAPEREAFRRWAPLVALLDVERWSAKEKRDAVLVIRAKGARSEDEHLARFEAHKKLSRAVRRLAR